MTVTVRNGLIASCGLAIALGAGACNRSTVPDASRDRAATGVAADTAKPAGHEGAEMTLTGCLQKGSGMNNFILTEVNSPSGSVGTVGSAEPSTPAREQMRSAKHTYRLDGDKDNLEGLVGKQVRVSGTLDELSDLNQKPADADRDRAARDRPDIDQGDLAKLKVRSVEKVADACGAASSKPSGQ